MATAGSSPPMAGSSPPAIPSSDILSDTNAPPPSSPLDSASGSHPVFFEDSVTRTPGRRSLTDRLADRTDRLAISDVSSPLRYESQSSSRSHNLSSDIFVSEDTPRRARRGELASSDFASLGRREVDMHSEVPGSEATITGRPGILSSDTDVGGTASTRAIWGTNINYDESIRVFSDFLMGFKVKHRMIYDQQPIVPGQGEQLVYRDMFAQMRQLSVTYLNLDTRNLLAFPSTEKFYYQLINYPAEVVPIMDEAVRQCMVTMVTESGAYTQAEVSEVEDKVYRVRPFNLVEKSAMRQLNPSDIDRLVSIKGLVLRASAIIPDMQQAFFQCNVCGSTTTSTIDKGVITEPTHCVQAACGSRNSMQIVHNRSIFGDKQIVRLQETPEMTPDGQTPHSLSLCAYDDLVDFARAGDRVEIVGIYRSVPVRINPRQRTLKTLFKTYVDVVHIGKVDTKRMDAYSSLEAELASAQASAQAGLTEESSQQSTEADGQRSISDSDLARIREVAARPDAYSLLSRSLAPSIFEQDDVKKGILLQLFGGTNKTFTKSGAPRYRGDINILLCGDPSTSKSQLLGYVHKIAPRGIYTSGKGSSAVGLTAYLTRDLETRQLVLESGALVLSDGGVCCIDEFDKMSDSTRSVLHEVMEQQTVSIAKAGIITTLNARTSILASANPIDSKYDTTKSVPKNIDLPPTLLSRFDLVYLMLDKIDAQSDRQLATHLTNMYVEDETQTGAQDEILPIEFLTMYISYAKQHIHPKISEEAKNELVSAYVEMRRLGDDARSSDKRITATTRQLESMIRLSEAHAKMRLSSEVTRDDVLESVRLIKSAIKEYATDPLTGAIDMDLVQTGTSAAERRLGTDLKKRIIELVQASVADDENGYLTQGALQTQLNTGSMTVDSATLNQALEELRREDKLAFVGGHSGPSRRLRLA